MGAGQRIGRAIRSQFMRPRGLAGRLAGWEMAVRSSNRKRNVWAVGLLDVQPGDRVLEIGFGPGVAVGEMARRGAKVVGIDHSVVMVAQARRRNVTAVREGRVDLRLGSVENLPVFDEPFDKVLAVNNSGMWPDPVERFRELARAMRSGGKIAIVSQPRCPGATAETTAAAASQIAGLLEGAGFVVVGTQTLGLDPPVACVIGER